jgi:hypothetical protein
MQTLERPTVSDSIHVVEAIATDVRYWAEGKAEGFSKDLNGWCAIASGQLFRELEKKGFQPKLRAAVDRFTCWAHVFVVLDDQIIDVTATQFREFKNQPVVIGHEKELQKNWFHQHTDEFISVPQLRAWQKKERWPAREIAYG